MSDATNIIAELSKQYKSLFADQKVILPFDEFIGLVRAEPRRLIRNAATYIRDTFVAEGHHLAAQTGTTELMRFALFDKGTEQAGTIVGGELYQNEIFNILQGFVRSGHANRLLLLHGPNGSAKSSTIESIGNAMQRYSSTSEGAVYSFNWIFPSDKNATPAIKGEVGPIGFGGLSDDGEVTSSSYALLDDLHIASKIHSEFRDNPIFLIPMPQRAEWLRSWIASTEGCLPNEVELPPHILGAGLSKRNQLILENLLAAYDGDFAKVLRHVQVERFFYSRQYRVGFSTVEPRMAIDAAEKQLTMDKNIQNLPTVLHNIRYFEAQGEIVEANRGILEFSDLLKRPIEAFKYLLTAVEKAAINLPSSTAPLDMVFVATTNEKHLDAFKTIPDFSSFRGRFELVTVPYLLKPSLEEKIYEGDIKNIEKTMKVAPHSLNLLCLWAVLTRLKQPDLDTYDAEVRDLVGRVDPRTKVKLHEHEHLRPTFKGHDEARLRELRDKIINESVGLVVYEGRFGASPREVRGVLQRASQNPKYKSLVPMAIFDELEKLVRDRSVYEFLQIEPRGTYHDASHFIEIIRGEFADRFENEVLRSMSLIEEEEYEKLLQRYVDNVVASVKNERLYNPTTEHYEPPSEALMSEVEKIAQVKGDIAEHRHSLLSRIAAYRIDHPKNKIDVAIILHEMLTKIEMHYYGARQAIVREKYQSLLAIDTPTESGLEDSERSMAKETYERLQNRFGYEPSSAKECLKFMLAWHKTKGRPVS